jgi:hypothetical protein
MAHFQLVTVLTLVTALVWGMSLTLLGSLKLALARRLQLEGGMTGTFHRLFNLLLIPLVLLAGLLVDRLGGVVEQQGIRLMLIVGSVLLAVALFSLTVRHTPGRGFALVLMAAFGVACLSTANLVLMPVALLSSSEYSASLNLGLVFVALGALLTAPLGDLMLDRLGLRRSLSLLALVALLPAFFAAAVPRDQLTTMAQPDTSELFTRETLWLAALVFFLYTPLEATLVARSAGLLLPTERTDRSPGVLAQAPPATGWFWLAFVASRAVLAWLQSGDVLGERWDSWILVFTCLLVAVAIGNLAGSPSHGRTRIAAFLLGLFLGPVVPTTLGMVLHYVAQTEPGTAYGVLFAAGSLGSAVFAPLVRIQPGRTTLVSLRLPLLVSLLLTGTMLVFCLVVQ